MNSKEIRQKFLDFFEKRDHAVVPSSSLVPDDPSVLLTTAGMQQFKPYYSNLDPTTTIHPLIGKPIGKNAVSCQKSFRTSDIDEVGDESHLTFFEMLGNFSFGGYFKQEAITWAHEFITKEMELQISFVTIFEGKDDIGVPKDTESRDIWKSLDSNIKIVEQGMDDVFWGPTGSSGPCGPTTEIYCKNADGQDVEIWNIVFNQFLYPGSREDLNAGPSAGEAGKKLEPLVTPGVDTGMGLERLVMVKQGTKNVFETDLFTALNKKQLPSGGEEYIIPAVVSERVKRIMLDHIRAIGFLVSDGVRPSNKGAGYILRRLTRRIVVHEYLLNEAIAKGHLSGTPFDFEPMLTSLIAHYGDVYPIQEDEVLSVYGEEHQKFLATVRKGLRELEKIPTIDAPAAFRLYESYGLPFEVVKELGRKRAAELSREEFEREFERHQERSRAGSEAKFGGHGLYLKTGEVTIRDESEVEKVTRYHTATHLLHAALRAVLGSEVQQDGSDITVERTRFDFRFPRKVSSEELKKVEAWVNDAIKKDLTVQWEEKSFVDATTDGALGFFREKYPERVKVYTFFDPKTKETFSKELCGGPHTEHTNTIGKFKIVKEESSSAGVRRIRGVIEP